MPPKSSGKSDTRIVVGIGGWVFEPWRGTFYPKGLSQKRELEYASSKLTSIEINGTFYGSQKPESFAKWHAETPENFIFALKGPRFASNRRVLAEAGESVKRFFESGVSELKKKLGPINWQFAPTKKFDAEDFEAFLALLPKKVDGLTLRHAIEVRHDSFKCPEFVALARKYKVATILALDSQYPLIPDVTAPFVYVRAMGTTEGEKLGYGKASLDKFAKDTALWAAGKEPTGLDHASKEKPAVEPRDVFFYVISGHKVANPLAAQALIERLK